MWYTQYNGYTIWLFENFCEVFDKGTCYQFPTETEACEWIDERSAE